jgi:predicted nucleic acid-binding protein
LIVDANVLVAVTPYVVAEVAYLVQKYAGPTAEIQFIESLRDGTFRQADVVQADLARIVQLMSQFRGFPLGVADASIVAIAERIREREIATIDGHFRAIRPHGIDYFVLLP